MKKYFTGKIAETTPMRPMSMKEHIIFWVTKVFYVAVFIVLPMFFAGVVPTLVGYGVMVFVTGVFIAVVFACLMVITYVPAITLTLPQLVFR